MSDSKLQDLDGPVGPWRGTAPLAASGIAVVCFVAALALAWMSAGTLLLIFTGRPGASPSAQLLGCSWSVSST